MRDSSLSRTPLLIANVHHLLRQLAHIDAANPLSRKLLLCPDLNYGRELLAVLARKQGSWVGWEVTTLRAIAGDLSAIALAQSKRQPGSDIEIAAMCDVAITHALPELHPSLAQLAFDAGTRSSILGTIQELRLGGIDETTINAQPFVFAKSVAAILRQYGKAIETNGIADTAWLFEQALANLDNEYPYTIGSASLFVVPSWSVIGLPARLLAGLIERGATVLSPRYAGLTTRAPTTLVDRFLPRSVATDDETAVARLHVADSSPSTQALSDTALRLQFVHAATPADELLAVLREVAARGARFDDVEIACTNVDSYGVALEAICTRVGVPATMLDGIPLSTTRIGRAIGRWLDWLDSGFNADILRRALEAGDFSDAAQQGPALARLLRRANVGWGREATRRAARRIAASAMPVETVEIDDSDDDVATLAIRRARDQKLALATLLDELLDIAPIVRDATARDEVPIACAAVARALSHMLDRIAVYDDAERATIDRLRIRIDAVAERVQSVMSSANAIAFVRTVLADVRAWTRVSDATRPRRAIGGHLHLTNVLHAGLTGRPHLFIVGLDADNVNGSSVQSSLLPDAVRSRFSDALRTGEERRRVRAAQIDAALAASSARVTLSFADNLDAAGKGSGAAQQFLEAWRRQHEQPNATYDDMRHALGVARNAVPRPEDVPLDARDLWLQLLQDPHNSALLRNAESLVRTHRPQVARGLDAIRIRGMAAHPTAWHGMVPAAAILDPRVTGAPVSPSSLEAFAACPLRWFYRQGLGVYAPRDLAFDEGRWLDAAMRGSLLHDVYDQVTRARLHEQDPAVGVPHALEILRVTVNRWRHDVPPPSDAVFRAELRLLEGETRFFLVDEHAKWRAEPWELVASELRFGSEVHAGVPLDDGSQLPIRGRIDRVDRLPAGLRVVDYKTGRQYSGGDDRAAFAGGRKLQLTVYAAAVAQAFDEPVVRAEFRFTTAVGGGTSIGASPEQLAKASDIVSGIVSEISHGRFLPTFDRNDCGFCDYAPICRTTPDRFGGTNSPRAAWANSNKTRPEFAAMREWRNKP